MRIASPVFGEGGIIPSRYTCEGENLSPPLEFHNIPPQAVSLVLIVDDPDVPAFVRSDRMYDHWVLYNIPPETRALQENRPIGTLGRNTSGQTGYTGPCPPDREHRYFFKLYALDCRLSLKAGASKRDVERSMEGHVISQAQLMGRYEKGKGY